MQRDVEKVEELYAAFRKRKLEGVLMLMAKDVEVMQSPELPWGGVYRGHEEVRQFFAKLSEHLESRIEVEGFLDAGDHVVVIGRTVGKARGTNLEFEVPTVHVWTLQDGLVTRFESFLDNPTLLAALNL